MKDRKVVHSGDKMANFKIAGQYFNNQDIDILIFLTVQLYAPSNFVYLS